MICGPHGCFESGTGWMPVFASVPFVVSAREREAACQKLGAVVDRALSLADPGRLYMEWLIDNWAFERAEV